MIIKGFYFQLKENDTEKKFEEINAFVNDKIDANFHLIDKTINLTRNSWSVTEVMVTVWMDEL